MDSQLPDQSSYDVAIAGARCAGAATALLLARAGLRVLVVDRGRYGTDTLSTHALMRGGVRQLARWGVLDDIRAAGTPPVNETTFRYGTDSLTVGIKPRDGVDALYAPRRRTLDRVLVDAAWQAGADIRFGVRVVGLVRSASGRVAGLVVAGEDGIERQIGASVVVGADGLRSMVATLAGAAFTRTAAHAAGVVYGYWPGLAITGYHWYYAPGLSGGAIPTDGGDTCVFATVPTAAFARTFKGDLPQGYRRVLGSVAPDIAAALPAPVPEGGFHGFAGHRGFFRESAGPGWALVGDAGYFKDPITAHGITDALRDAELLARAVLRDSDEALREYQASRDALSNGVFEVTDAIASFEWDLVSVRDLHKRLSEEMSLEVKTMASIFEGSLPSAAPRRAAIRTA